MKMNNNDYNIGIRISKGHSGDPIAPVVSMIIVILFGSQALLHLIIIITIAIMIIVTTTPSHRL